MQPKMGSINRKRRRRLSNKTRWLLVSLMIGCVLGALAGVGHIRSVKNWEKVESEWVKEQIEADRAYEAEVTAERIRWEQEESIQVTELTEEDAAKMHEASSTPARDAMRRLENEEGRRRAARQVPADETLRHRNWSLRQTQRPKHSDLWNWLRSRWERSARLVAWIA